MAIDARPEVVLIAETDAMRKAARRAGLVLGRRHRSRL
ncbi:hypothetical protein AKJ09_11220 [Labilithrix luteola]|uniref:Uncharacterized protein n=1 Tax=Labilithrix luteola TaxID=1391654 RepID=A0A0K1QFW9_9BACT|nr:hypothetical protein AKJ09_11220 [Labilithrix luteola]